MCNKKRINSNRLSEKNLEIQARLSIYIYHFPTINTVTQALTHAVPPETGTLPYSTDFWGWSHGGYIYGRVCKRRKLRVNVDKSKVMSVGGSEDPAILNIMLNGERMEVVNSFKYLGSCFSSQEGVKGGVGIRVNEGVRTTIFAKLLNKDTNY